MKNVRKQMLNGEKPPSCLKCYKEEAAGHKSKRMWETHYWGQRVDIDQILADTNEEGANLLTLQTRQSLSSTSLSFAAQADQNVLRLF